MGLPLSKIEFNKRFLFQHTMFGKKKKRPDISNPTNFEHRVHTGFDSSQGKFVGLPLQWASVVEAVKAARPKPIVDPSLITATDMQPLKVQFGRNVALIRLCSLCAVCD